MLISCCWLHSFTLIEFALLLFYFFVFTFSFLGHLIAFYNIQKSPKNLFYYRNLLQINYSQFFVSLLAIHPPVKSSHFPHHMY